MEIKVEVPHYDPDKGIEYSWQDGFGIEVKADNGIITIVANKAGLLSLANHLLNLAQDDVPAGHHLHFDEHNSLEGGSIELVIAKR